MRKIFAAIAFTSVCLLLAGCAKEGEIEEKDDPDPYLGNNYYWITEILYAASAEPNDAAAAIKIDMQNGTPFTIGDSHVFIDPQWTTMNIEGAESFEGTYVWETVENHPEVLNLLPPQTQILTRRKLTLENDGVESVFYLFIVKSNPTRTNFLSSSYDLWIYEDLTEHFQELYPGAEVDGAVWVQVCEPAGI